MILTALRTGHFSRRYMFPSCLGHSPSLCKSSLPGDKVVIADHDYRAFGLTSYTAGLIEVQQRYNVSRTVSILGYSIFLFGVFFAPIHTPHLSERFGRRPIYYAGFLFFCLFELGAGLSKTFAGVAILRFLAGLSGGPIVRSQSVL